MVAISDAVIVTVTTPVIPVGWLKDLDHEVLESGEYPVFISRSGTG
ncbi:hypothetical protein OAI60_00970 [Flavobacteriaceae bacterium]|nr:hypothetical protein [Flavobacteriaceae bacterium]